MTALDHRHEFQTDLQLENLDLVQLLTLIIDVQAPEPVPFWPQTAGWILLLLFAVLTISTLGALYYSRYRRNAYRRQAILELNAVNRMTDIPEQLSLIAAITKRVALVTFERTSVADASGNQWLEFLDQTCEKTDFSIPEAGYLTSGPYQRKSNASAEDVNKLLALISLWVKEHHA